jgi:hypothetical protein
MKGIRAVHIRCSAAIAVTFNRISALEDLPLRTLRFSKRRNHDVRMALRDLRHAEMNQLLHGNRKDSVTVEMAMAMLTLLHSMIIIRSVLNIEVFRQRRNEGKAAS